MTWKRGPHEKEKKSLSTKGLLAVVSAVFEKLEGIEKGGKLSIWVAIFAY
jgi:hypothetical protein